MPNRIPFAESPLAAGGYLLPTEQGDILTNGMLQEAGAIALAGDKRATRATKTQFTIWLGTPTAGPVGEGAPKPVTGAEFGQTAMNVKKFATIVLFTDEMIEDVQSGDLNVLVDSGVRSALNDVTDAYAIGKDSGVDVPDPGVFDTMLRKTATTVEYDSAKPDGLQLAISAAMGVLEGNGYGDTGQMGVLLGAGFGQLVRDARSTVDESAPVYGPGRDPLYGLTSFTSTNLNSPADAAAAGKIIGFVAHRPNIHVRIRKDVTVATSTDATIYDCVQDRKLFQEDLTAIRYETRLAYFVHDLDRAVVALVDAA
jgi:hypothetical protein